MGSPVDAALDRLAREIPSADYCREQIEQAQSVIDDPSEYPREYIGDAHRAVARYTNLTEAAEALATVRQELQRLREERDAARQMLALTCSDDVRLHGCACDPSTTCYLHGVLVPRALADGLPQVSVEEVRFMHAAGVEYVRAEAAEAELQRLREGLREFLEEFDFHAADYLVGNVDGEEARVFTARTVDLLIEYQRKARALLAAGEGQTEGGEA